MKMSKMCYRYIAFLHKVDSKKKRVYPKRSKLFTGDYAKACSISLASSNSSSSTPSGTNIYL